MVGRPLGRQAQLSAHRVGRLWELEKEKVDAWIEAGDAADCNKKDSIE